jgi:hypothetical protein
MKKFYVALILLLSFLVTPVLTNACEAMDMGIHKEHNDKSSHDLDSKMKKCQDGCHHHHQADLFMPKEDALAMNAVKISFIIFPSLSLPSAIAGPLLEPPAA